MSSPYPQQEYNGFYTTEEYRKAQATPQVITVAQTTKGSTTDTTTQHESPEEDLGLTYLGLS